MTTPVWIQIHMLRLRIFLGNFITVIQYCFFSILSQFDVIRDRRFESNVIWKIISDKNGESVFRRFFYSCYYAGLRRRKVRLEIMEEEQIPSEQEQEGEESIEMINFRRSKYLEMDDAPDEQTVLRSPIKLETFDDALPHVGDFGRYQIYLLFALFPYSVGYASLYFSQFFFTIAPKEHWCKIDALTENFTPEQRIQIAIPPSDTYPYFDTCNRKDLNFTSLVASGIRDINSLEWSTNRTVGCEKWEYNFTQIPYASLGAELDWVCENSYLISTSQMIFYCGSITGGFLFGWIADHRGRIPALVLCTGCGLLASFATAWTYTFWTFAVARFFTGLAFDNIINIPLIIVVEYMSVKKRTLVVNIAFGLYFALGSTLLPWAAYFIADWRILCYVSALPLLSCFITHWILPESARWYVSNRMSDKVIEKLKRIAKVNKRKPDARFYEIFYRTINSIENRVESATLADLFKTPRLARTAIILTAFWALTVVVFDSHVYSLKLLESSVFVSFSLACATELPAGILLTLLLDRWGRRFCGFITMASTTVFTLVELLTPSEQLKLIMSISARFALNMAANVGLQYAAELLPTPVRGQGVAMIHIFGIIAHSLAPYIVYSAIYWESLPLLIMTIAAALCAVLVLFLPETLGREMPQTLQDGEDFGKDQKFWSLPCFSKEKDRDQSNNNRNGTNGVKT